MKDREMREAAKKFVEYWKDRGYEKGESQPFWLSLLSQVFGVSESEKYIVFEEQVKLDHTSFIDGFIPSTHVLIEQKGRGKDLRKPIRQSDGSLLTPFQQAKRYSAELPYTKRPRWIITCNFEEFLIYDMEKPNGEPEEIKLCDLENECYRLKFLVDEKDEHIKKEEDVSILAGELVGKLYDAILKQYKDPTNPESLKSLNMLCVRLVFCLYAEDANIFEFHGQFHDYMAQFEPKDMRRALIDLFEVLDTKENERDNYIEESLAKFPYVNGGLFREKKIEIPNFTQEIKDLLLNSASDDFNWAEISPTIFGAVFESTLNPETRRSGGMHYTSVENIHKVIDPLFLDDLKSELEEIKEITGDKARAKRLNDYREKLSCLTFLDPACGSGNFLTETYLSLRKLENEALETLTHGQMMLEIGDVIKVDIGQFYGIEINDFAVVVAMTALWIAECQMLKRTEDIMHMDLDFLPLDSYANIVEDNALRIDWEDVVPKDKLSYIMGNPPFVGHKNVNQNQKDDMIRIFNKKQGRLDYVSAWYKIAVDYIEDTSIECAFVSTNTIVQGIHIEKLWSELIRKGVFINFAYRTFVWNSEANEKANVHCVIIGFSKKERKNKQIFDGNGLKTVNVISPYLSNGENETIVKSRNTPLSSNVPKMVYGNVPRDGGHYTFNSKEELIEFLKNEPKAKPYIHKFIGAREFINNIDRWFLLIENCPPNELRQMPMVLERIRNVREFRLSSKAKEIQKFAQTPTKLAQHTQPFGIDFIAVPIVSSSRRKYLPIGYVDGSVLTNNQIQIIPYATLYHFGIIASNVHNAWMRKTCGRLKSDYRYSKDMVYNTFPWPNPTDEQKAKIEQTAQAILDARSLYPDCSLADLYDELTMPVELRKAHQMNNRAVWEAYGKSWDIRSESDCVSHLMKLYQELTKE